MATHTTDKTNMWFAISLALMGFIVGYATAKFSEPKQVLLPSNVPTAPLAQEETVDASVTEKIMTIANALGLDESEFQNCMDSNKFMAKIDADIAGASKAGITGTPGNILLDIKTGTARDVGGAMPYEDFQKNIEEMLVDPKSKPSNPDIALITAPIVPVNISEDRIRGNTSAKLAIIEHSDMECPFCKMVHPTLQQVVQNYGNDVMWVYRNFPLDGHAGAKPLAHAAECAQEVGGDKEYFWKFVDGVFAE